jgi:hypothetical protein
VLLLRLLRTSKDWCAALELHCLQPVLQNALKVDNAANVDVATFASRDALFGLIKYCLHWSGSCRNVYGTTRGDDNARKTQRYAAAISCLQLAQLEERDRGHLIPMASREMYHTGRPFRESPYLSRIFCYAGGLPGLPPEFQNKRVTMDLSSGQVPNLYVVHGMSHHDVALALLYEHRCREQGRPVPEIRPCACVDNHHIAPECREHWALQRAAIYADMESEVGDGLLLMPPRPYAQFCDIVVVDNGPRRRGHHIFSNECNDFRKRCFHCSDALRSDERRRHQAIVLEYEHDRNHEAVKRVCNDIVVV